MKRIFTYLYDIHEGMSELFITDIRFNDYNGKVQEIVLSQNHKKHLILTGKNGSGKSYLLNRISNFLANLANTSFKSNDDFWVWLNRSDYSDIISQYYTPVIRFDSNIVSKVIAGGVNCSTNVDVENIAEAPMSSDQSNVIILFFNYLATLHFRMVDAHYNKNIERFEAILRWFEKLRLIMRNLFKDDDFELRFDSEKMRYLINYKRYTDHEYEDLPDGYKSVFIILAKIILRVLKVSNFDLSRNGFVLIDEIESHLHIELQKSILPALIDLFPGIQFIVTTHSPFVLQSMENVVVYDMQKNMQVEGDLNAYSYDAIIESYFGVDKYSEEVKNKVVEYENLLSVKSPLAEQKVKLRELKYYFSRQPTFLSKELQAKILELQIKEQTLSYSWL